MRAPSKPPKNYWLMKSEPNECSAADAWAAPQHTIPWTGVRNYQARNFLRDRMQIGDGVFFYHSSCATPGIAGLAHVSSIAFPDPTQFDGKDPYFDAKANPERPRWWSVDVTMDQLIPLIPLSTLRQHNALATMKLLARGNRLSITPVSAEHWHYITHSLIASSAQPRT